MKKLLSILSFLLFLIFAGSGLYVFGLPPFQAGGPFINGQNTAGTNTAAPKNQPEEKTGQPLTTAINAKTAAEHLQKGRLLEDNNFIQLAIAEYQEAAKLDPNNPEPLLKIGKILLRNKNFDAAQSNFENILKLDQSSLEAKIYLGRTLLAERKINEAKNIFDGLNAENQEVKYYQGMLAAYFGDYEKSKNFFKNAIETGTKTEIAAKTGISKKAQNFLDAFSEFDFNQGASKTHLKTLLARSFDQAGEYQLAIGILFDVIKDKKDYRDAWIILGHAYLSLEKYQDALEALNEAKKLDPQKPDTFFLLGLTSYGLGDLKQAAALLEMAKKLGYEPQIQLNQKLGEIYMQLKDYEQAAKNYENVVNLNDNDINYYIRPIWLYLEKLNQPEKALQLAEKALNSHPQSAMSFNLLAWAQIWNNQLQQAETNLQIALQLNPGLDAAYLNFGLLEEKKGEFTRAIAYYKKAHDLGKDDSVSNSAADRYNQLVAKTKMSDPGFKPGFNFSPGLGNENLKANLLKEP